LRTISGRFRPWRCSARRLLYPLSLFILLFLASPGTFAQAVQAQRYASQGLELAQSGKLKKAEIELREAVALDPQNASYLADLGGVFGMEGNLKQAGVFLGKALRLDSQNRMIRRDLAANEWQLGQFTQAKENLERLLRDKPDDKAATLLLGMVEANLRDYRRAAQLLGSVPSLVDQHPESLAALARSYYHTDQTVRARETLMSMVARFRDPRFVFLAGEMAEEGRDAETAAKLFQAVRTTYPDPPRLVYHLARVAYLAGRFNDCQRMLSQLVASGYRSSQNYGLLGQCYAKQNKMRRAMKAYEISIVLNRSSDSNYLALASLLSDHRLRDTAIQVMASCVEAFPKAFDCYEEKGRIESAQHYFKQAVASFSRAAQLNPASADAEFGLAASLAGLGRRQEAATAYETAIRLDPHRAEFYRGYAMLLLAEAGRSNAALNRRAASLLQKAISLDASDGESRLLLGELWFGEERIRRALPLLQAAARLEPENGRPHYLLWRAYQKLGRESEAKSELAEFKKLSLKGHEPENRD
jgi:Flp pilus assembly protein TadD